MGKGGGGERGEEASVNLLGRVRVKIPQTHTDADPANVNGF